MNAGSSGPVAHHRAAVARLAELLPEAVHPGLARVDREDGRQLGQPLADRGDLGQVRPRRSPAPSRPESRSR